MYNTLSLLLLAARGTIHVRTPCGWVNPWVSPLARVWYHTYLIYGIEQLAQDQGLVQLFWNFIELT